jgi:hypothetical protein
MVVTLDLGANTFDTVVLIEPDILISHPMGGVGPITLVTLKSARKSAIALVA